MGLELSGVPDAKEHALELDLSRKLAVSPFKSLADFAARVRSRGRTVGIFIWHNGHFPSWEPVVRPVNRGGKPRIEKRP